MSEFGEVVELEVEPDGRSGEASVVFATHAEAERAVAKAKHLDLKLSYNERPYSERGWPIFEDAVSREAIVWARRYNHGASRAIRTGASVSTAKVYYISPDGVGSQLTEEGEDAPEEIPSGSTMRDRLDQARATLH